MGKQRAAHQAFANQPEGNRWRGRPKSRWWDCVYKDIKKCKINRWNERSKDRVNWKRLVEEAKFHIGL